METTREKNGNARGLELLQKTFDRMKVEKNILEVIFAIRTLDVLV